MVKVGKQSDICKYVGQNVCDTEIDMDLAMVFDFHPDKPLVTPAKSVLIGYPFGDLKEYPIHPAAITWGELVISIKRVCIEQDAAGHNVAPHDLGDYIIESICVYRDGVATVSIGS